VLGAEGEAQLIARIAAETGAQVVSTNSAVQACIGRYAPRRVAVITPYVDELNRSIQAGLERVGLNVVRIVGLGLIENVAIGAVGPPEIVTFAEQALAGLEFDLLFVSCTNFRALEARQALAARFGVPVVTSNQATIEASFAALGLPAGLPTLAPAR
jgi:maleate isomerase